MKQITAYCGLLVLSLTTITASAQDSTSNQTPSYFKFSANYQNDNVYLGRKDSVAVPYLSPSIGYFHKSGLFFTASGSYLSTEKRFDAFLFDAGYSFSKNKWDGEFTAEKSFYSSQSYSVKSEIKGNVNGNVGYDLGFIKPTLSAAVDFGSNMDIASSLGIEHTFSFADDAADITPTLVGNASTQNNYDAYYRKRKFRVTKRGKLVVYNITAIPLNVASFKLLDYEASLPVNYSKGKFSFNLTPVYAIPVNPNRVQRTAKGSNGTTTTKVVTEKIAPTFFWSAAIAFKL